MRRIQLGTILLMALLPTFSSPGRTLPSVRETLFQEKAHDTGLRFTHHTGATGEFFLPEIMGSGVALLDYDNDGDLDVYLVQAGGLPPLFPAQSSEPRPPRPEGTRYPGSGHLGNRLFRNLLKESGKLRFLDVTEKAGVGDQGYGMGAAVGDYDNDGYPDLYVTNVGSNRLYHNNSDGTFTDVTAGAGVNDERWSTSAAFLDYDSDGHLDLFVVNYVDFTVKGNKHCRDAVGEQDYCSPAVYNPHTDRLFRNEGNGTFLDVSAAAGITRTSGAGLGVSSGDFDGNGQIDLYVANDGMANHLWLNQGDGTFQEAGLTSGSAYNLDAKPEAGMGVAVGDFDRDADEDIFVTNLTRETNTLYLNDGSANFMDATVKMGLAGPSIPYTGFGTGWLDYDNDGLLDIFVANGAVAIEESLRGEKYPYTQKNLLFKQLPLGCFIQITDEPALEVAEVSRAAAFGDIDNDGDVDVLISNNKGPVRLLLNQAGSKNHWLSVQLQGQLSNSDGLGALVTVISDEAAPLYQRVRTDGSYLASNDVRVHFGLGTATKVNRIKVCWPSGLCETWDNLRPDMLLLLKEGSGSAQGLGDN